MQVNDITIAGYLGRDAEDRSTTTGTRIVSFSLCHSEKGRDGKPDVATWVKAKVFGPWCDYAATFKKGDNVIVKGRLNVNLKEKDGVTHTYVDVIASSLGHIVSKDSKQTHPRAGGNLELIPPYRPVTSPPPNDYADHIPF